MGAVRLPTLQHVILFLPAYGYIFDLISTSDQVEIDK